MYTNSDIICRQVLLTFIQYGGIYTIMFDNNISVLIPYKAADEYREKNFLWVKNRYETIMPNAEICIGEYNGEPFSKSIAINNAAKKATRDIFIIVDADIIFNVEQIKNAIEALNFHSWVIPYRSIIYLDSTKTNELYKKNTSIVLDEVDFYGCSKIDIVNEYEFIGGINIVPRNYFERIGGFDERFKGWGGEDDAFQMALDTICGKYFRLDATIWHLYHTPQSIENRVNNIKILQEFYKDKDTISYNFNNKSN